MEKLVVNGRRLNIPFPTSYLSKLFKEHTKEKILSLLVSKQRQKFPFIYPVILKNHKRGDLYVRGIDAILALHYFQVWWF